MIYKIGQEVTVVDSNGNKMTKQELLDMPLLTSAHIQIGCEESFDIIRVSGGWIYSREIWTGHNHPDGIVIIVTSTFVPEPKLEETK